MADFQDKMRMLPSIEKLMQAPELTSWQNTINHSIRVLLAQELVADLREEIQSGKACPSFEEVSARLAKRYERLRDQQISRVINGTGIVLHTNLGRAPLGRAVLERMTEVLAGYSTLEFDERKGERGSRSANVERLLSLVCGTPAALVVNNNAGAVFHILHTLVAGQGVAISRGELVQIGGGFRIPDILQAGGATLHEVGTTNITQLSDYEKVLKEKLEPPVKMILKVHQSNFYMEGHSEEVPIVKLVELGKKHQVPVVVDLGSGCLIDQNMDPHERTVREVLRSGAQLVCFSGDKLVGGPQAGIILGDKEIIEKLKKAPLYRALRLGKTELFLLEQILHKYVRGALPAVWRLLNQTQKEIRERCERVKETLDHHGRQVDIVEGTSPIGGGAMPASAMATYLLEPKCEDPEKFVKTLRLGKPCVVVRRENKRIFLDLRTVFAEEEPILIQRLLQSWE